MNDSSKRWWDFWSAFLLLVILTIISSRLVATNWTPHLRTIQFLTLIAFSLGLLLGISHFPLPVVFIFSFNYGAFAIPCTMALVLTDQEAWLTRIFSLASRLQTAATFFIQKKPVNDPILFLCLMAVLFWSLSIYAGYQLTRSASFWKIIIPAGLIFLIINHYDRFSNSGLGYLGFFIFLSMLLLGRVAFLKNQTLWQKNGITLSSEIRGELIRASFLMVAGLVFIAWLVPVNFVYSRGFSDFWAKNIIQPWEQLSSNTRNAFTSLRSQSPVEQVSFGDTLLLSHGSPPQNTVLFTVKANQPLPEGAQYYWRARTFDTYSNGQWSAASTQTQSFTQDTYHITYPEYVDRVTIEFTFTTQTIFVNLPSPAMPIWIDHSVNVFEVPAPGGKQDVFGLTPALPLGRNEVYHVRALISAPNLKDLEASSTTYPEQITARYLSISSTLASKLKPLALQITADAQTPYEKANAITQWLRANIHYEATLSTDIPAGEDPVIWFLFDSKTGFCDYYASAEVLLLRSIGIPARLSEGYASGSYQATTNTYIVHQSDAHAWPEVYFPELGWIEFEPTSSQSSRTLPLTQTGSSTGALTIIPTKEDQGVATYEPINPVQSSSQSNTSFLVPLLIILIFIVLPIAIFTAYMLRRRYYNSSEPEKPFLVVVEEKLRKYGIPVPLFIQHWSQRATLTPIERTFRVLRPLLSLYRMPNLAWQTPAERISLLVEALPEGAEPAHALLSEYQKAEYSLHPVNLVKAREAASRLRRIAWKTFYRHILFLDRIKG